MTDSDKEIKYADIGERLRKIRLDLGYTLDSMSKAAGLARSYISQFEKGSKYPNRVYLKFLFEQHNIDLNYVLGGEGTPNRLSAEERRLYTDFGKFNPEIKELLYYMNTFPHALYHILSCFAEYKLINRDLIERFKAALEQGTQNNNDIKP